MNLFMAVYDNSVDPFIPEQWANESIAILLENMVAANLVHRDFEMEFQRFGDVVNTRKPREFSAKRKGVNDDVTVQAAAADNVAVTLNQHVHVSFLIRDGEETKSFKDLVTEFLRPASIAMARAVDQIVLGQVYQFLENSAGSLGGLTTSNGPTFITDTRKVMNNNKVPMDGRQLILTSNAESKLLQNAIFIQANTVGDQGGAMAEATLGRKFGFDLWLDQNMSSIPSQTVLTLTINNGNIAAGSTVLTVDDTGDTPTDPGRWITIRGIPYHTVDSGATSLTLEYGLREAIVDGDPVYVYAGTTITEPYDVGYSKELDVASAAGVTVGQLVTIGVAATAGRDIRYTVIAKNETGTDTVTLDRPLEQAVLDNAVLNFGPSGDYNWAFHRNAVSLVIRPLAMPRAGTGALSGLANFNGVAMRTTITYNGLQQGHLVTLDFLAGIKVLDDPLGAVMLS
jgi:hypothetical protein